MMYNQNQPNLNGVMPVVYRLQIDHTANESARTHNFAQGNHNTNMDVVSY